MGFYGQSALRLARACLGFAVLADDHHFTGKEGYAAAAAKMQYRRRPHGTVIRVAACAYRRRSIRL